ncbi:MAG: diaminopimelate decarboxylase [Planctomycetota bacterium]
MDHFAYRDGELWADGLRAAELADRFGTPLYVYTAATIAEHISRFRQAFAPLNPGLRYAVKASGNLQLIRLMAELGMGADAVSQGEVERAWLAGVPMDQIVMAGVAKTDDEIASALSGAHSPLAGSDLRGPAGAGPEHRGPIGRFNVESEGELLRIDRVARSLGSTPQHAAHCSLRVNPDVDAHAHAYTTTGTHANKFGVPIEHAADAFDHARALDAVTLDGLHLHLGSPILSTEPFKLAITKALDLIDELARRGHAIRSLNIGGGFAADYHTGQAPWARQYADTIVPMLEPRVREGLEILLEPGRTIMASAGVLLVRVVDVKRTISKRFIVCDAGMNALVRPSLYGAEHFVWPTRPGDALTPLERAVSPKLANEDIAEIEPADVVGPLCESSDFLARDRRLPPVQPGEVLAVFTAGAYGMSMATTYNDRPKPAEALVQGDEAELIRRRQTLADLLAPELSLRSPQPNDPRPS